MPQGRFAFALACAAIACAAPGCAACGKAREPVEARRDAGRSADAAAVDVPSRAIGLPELAAYQWRRRGGHPAYRIARKAEAAADWETVVTTCRQALTADPGHLEAAWLLAAALGRLNRTAEILEPLHLAAAGDVGKWAHASLDHPAFASFLATPAGEAWRRRVEQDREAYTAALARSLIVTAGGDLYAYEAAGPRWYRLTHTYGAVIGGMRVPEVNQIVYVTRQRLKGKRDTTLAAGLVDLAHGRTLKPIELGTKGPLTIAYSTKKQRGVWIGTRGARPVWQLLEENGKLGPLPPRSQRPAGPWLDVTGKTARPRTIPVDDVTADFDDKGLASAIRIGRSNRILSIPSPGLIDGNSVQWSSDRARLAFVAQLDDQCAPGAVNAAAFVADPMTGALRELERAAGGLTVDWLTESRPAVAGDHGVTIIDLDGGAPIVLDGADGLLAPRLRPKCSAPEPDDAPPADDADLPEAAAVPVADPAGAAAKPVPAGPTPPVAAGAGAAPRP